MNCHKLSDDYPLSFVFMFYILDVVTFCFMHIGVCAGLGLNTGNLIVWTIWCAYSHSFWFMLGLCIFGFMPYSNVEIFFINRYKSCQMSKLMCKLVIKP